MLRMLLMGTTAIARVPNQPLPYVSQPYEIYGSDGYFFDIKAVKR